MRVLFSQNMIYLPTYVGASKSNRILLEALAARGHQCEAVVIGCRGDERRPAFYQDMRQRGIEVATGPEYDTFAFQSVRVLTTTSSQSLASLFGEEIERFEPDCIIIGEDPGYMLLDIAQSRCPDRVVFLARTTLMLPFGPGSNKHDAGAMRKLAQTAHIVAVSEYVKSYIQQYGNIDCVVLPICLNGPGPFPNLGKYGDGFVTLINPCAYKGLSIFTGLARMLPQITFAAVPTWGTTKEDQALLQGMPNMRILSAADDIERIFSITRVLLVPSLWAEAKANVITESLLRGVPVLASNIGGNPEAMLGQDFVLPVNEISHYSNNFDEHSLPIATVPDQDLDPWRDALVTTLSSPEVYRRMSQSGHAAAVAANLVNTIAPLECLLTELCQ
jgi:glycosyltransferase involved in cell wall biosynthesis